MLGCEVFLSIFRSEFNNFKVYGAITIKVIFCWIGMIERQIKNDVDNFAVFRSGGDYKMIAFLQDTIHLQGLGSVFLLCGFLIASTMIQQRALQQRALQQSTEVLQTAAESVKRTALFVSATDYLERRQSPSASTQRF